MQNTERHPDQKQTDQSGPALSQHEMRELVLNLLTTRGPRGATEDEVQFLLESANNARLNWLLFQCAITNKTRVDIINGELCAATSENLIDYQRSQGYIT